MKFFTKIVNDREVLIVFAKSSFVDVCLGFEYTSTTDGCFPANVMGNFHENALASSYF